MPPRKVFLHIGTPKSGTTYLQALWSANRRRLRDLGVLWPGRDWFDQVNAVRDLLQAHPHGHRTPDVDGAWDRLVEEVQGWNGDTALLSMEWLVSAGPEAVHRAVHSLAPAEPHLVVTVRDIARNVPAQWQESVRNKSTWTFSEYLDGVTSTDAWSTPAGKDFWEQHDLGHVLSHWNVEVPLDRTYVVAVPPAGADPDVLWHRFAKVLDVPSTGCVQPDDRNTSLGAPSAELMRRLNVVAEEEGLEWPVYDEVLKAGLAAGVLSRRSTESRLSLPARHRPWADAQARRLLQHVKDSGAHLIGEPDDLLPAVAATDDGAPDAPDPEALLAAALDGMVGIAALVHTRLAETRGERDDARAAQSAAVAELDAYRALSPSRRVKRCLVELADQVTWLGRAYAAFRFGRRLAAATARRSRAAAERWPPCPATASGRRHRRNGEDNLPQQSPPKVEAIGKHRAVHEEERH